MIIIYRGEDTDFANQEPIQVKLKTSLDLTGYTADILFGSIIKHYETGDVASKILPLSFSAAETASFFPGKGFASVKVYDPEGRVAILKRFVMDVKFRHYGDSRIEPANQEEEKPLGGPIRYIEV